MEALNLNVLFEDNHVIVVEKPPMMPVNQDESLDESLLEHIKQYIKTTRNKPNEAYVSLVHRLDRPVGGVMVFALSAKAASRLSESVRLNQFVKRYVAITARPLKPGTLVDNLLKDEKTNTTIIHPKGKKSELIIEAVDTLSDQTSRLWIRLVSGRSHQIRVQTASRFSPILYDQRYNPKTKPTHPIALFAYELSFPHPTKKDILTFSLPLPQRHPFTLFKD
ncbi:MAG: RluA family pseudouridine synthase [Erysipelothrix sp.]|jgi:23S rRNA pseudouridine1911/1915/1917 synthase|nr:RluA family pseudouridine synthase [Erysipelothrix sp.]